ncbi:hypothetical protein DM860_001158 [Cuscuta australis]|uniref:Uncharacterized protein n=1 Tax=Cuscuta australis TaxID=267555 RepID=A0A328DWI5_9ASTE|nr:hypothetical protein DM860_001158 [Cuscuta australis]
MVANVNFLFTIESNQVGALIFNTSVVNVNDSTIYIVVSPHVNDGGLASTKDSTDTIIASLVDHIFATHHVNVSIPASTIVLTDTILIALFDTAATTLLTPLVNVSVFVEPVKTRSRRHRSGGSQRRHKG